MGFFGNVKKVKVEDYYYVYSNWRRLTLSKITFMRDSFYSTLASSMNSVMSSPNPTTYLISKKLEKIFCLRTIISYATNQKIAELLMDLRYAYMSSLSIYTNISKLLTEKFGSPYHTCFEIWLIHRIFTRLKLIHQKAITDGINQKRIEMDLNVRKIDTIGGLIDMPSLWFDYNMHDITELLDETFIYVHTMKEPSNIFHENIKALKTIIQYQNEYENLPSSFKDGEFTNSDDFEKFLLYDTKIGCCTSIIIDSVKYTIAKEKPNFKKIIHKLNDESIGEVLSTKAVIADIDREIIQNKETTKRDIKKKKKKNRIYRKKTII